MPRSSSCRPKPSRRFTPRPGGSARFSRTWSSIPETRALDLDSAEYTENTRGSYPIHFIDNAELSGRGGHPTNVIMLTADAWGVLPPIARSQSRRSDVSLPLRYTARVAGTEKGVTEPKAAFSTCFGAPFLPLNPNVYAKMLGEKIARHRAAVWLVNTGWTGGPYGVGSRMKIAHTRAMITAALTGQLAGVRYEKHPVFNLDVPTDMSRCAGQRPRTRATRGPIPRGTTPRRRSWRGCSWRISRRSRTSVPASVKEAGPKG